MFIKRIPQYFETDESAFFFTITKLQYVFAWRIISFIFYCSIWLFVILFFIVMKNRKIVRWEKQWRKQKMLQAEFESQCALNHFYLEYKTQWLTCDYQSSCCASCAKLIFSDARVTTSISLGYVCNLKSSIGEEGNPWENLKNWLTSQKINHMAKVFNVITYNLKS